MCRIHGLAKAAYGDEKWLASHRHSGESRSPGAQGGGCAFRITGRSVMMWPGTGFRLPPERRSWDCCLLRAPESEQLLIDHRAIASKSSIGGMWSHMSHRTCLCLAWLSGQASSGGRSEGPGAGDLSGGGPLQVLRVARDDIAMCARTLYSGGAKRDGAAWSSRTRVCRGQRPPFREARRRGPGREL